MKRLLALILSSLLILPFAACTKTETASSSSSSAANATAQSEDSSSSAQANAGFPKKNIKIIVPFDAGGGVDVTCRIISDAAGKDYFNGNSLIVENMPGGGAVIGQTNVANSAPDGYTMLAYTSSVVSNPMFNETTFEYTDFTTIAMYCFDPELLVVPKDSPYNTLDEFIEGAKNNSLTLSTPGHTTSHHIAALKMEDMMGMSFNYLHNDGASAQLQQIMGGHADSALISVGEGAALVADGSIKALGVMSDDRMDSIPDVSTYKEVGYEMVDGAFRGLAVPKDTPQEVVDALDAEFNKILNSQKFIDSMNAAKMPIGYQNSEDFSIYVKGVAEALEKLLPVLKAE